MVTILFTLCFLLVFLLTKSYKYFSTYYPTVQYVTLVAISYPLICRGYMVWSYADWGLFTEKANELTQAAILFPSITVLFLRFLPKKVWTRTLYFLGYLGIFALMEVFLVLRQEIIYRHGWSFGWSMFIDVCLFSLMWIHEKNWKVALSISFCILLFLVIVFRVPVTG